MVVQKQAQKEVQVKVNNELFKVAQFKYDFNEGKILSCWLNHEAIAALKEADENEEMA